LLTNEVTSFDGEFYRCTAAETIPLPIQRPRPPITIAAHGPKMLAIAAERADGWSSWGGYDVETEEQMFAVTRDRSHRFDDLCVDAGRDPRSIRHSLVAFYALTPWESVEYFRHMRGQRSGGVRSPGDSPNEVQARTPRKESCTQAILIFLS
jgi:alkanesulfonate monooxygenase SsuD/methylene tetrahydromethanopterin reductase-like flavin-dependent oxidoreductase (luciferase family)